MSAITRTRTSTSPAARRTVLDAVASGRVIRSGGWDWRHTGARPNEPGGDRVLVAVALIRALVDEQLIRRDKRGKWHLTAAGEAARTEARKGSRPSTQDGAAGHTEPQTMVVNGRVVVLLDGVLCCVYCLERAGDCRMSGGAGPCEGQDEADSHLDQMYAAPTIHMGGRS